MSPCLIGQGVTLCRPPAAQPLTRFVDDAMVEYGGLVIVTVYPARRQFRCHRCRARRWAKNLTIVVQAWYDPLVICADRCRRRKRTRRASGSA